MPGSAVQRGAAWNGGMGENGKKRGSEFPEFQNGEPGVWPPNAVSNFLFNVELFTVLVNVLSYRLTGCALLLRDGVAT